MKIRFAVPAALVLLASACSDLPTAAPPVPAPAPAPVPGDFHAELRCTVSVARGLACGGDGQADGDLPNLIVGGQDVYVRLDAFPGVYNAADSTYTIDVTVENRMAQIFGTPNGYTGTGLRVFFHRPVEVTKGTGPASLDNADSTGVFLSAGQPYFIYPGKVDPGNVSAPRTWRFKLGPQVEEFQFGVFVQGDMPRPEGMLLFRHWYMHGSNEVEGLWSAPGGEVFAVGFPALVMRNTGAGWIEEASPTGRGLWDVWGSSATDVFAVGDGATIVHWDGTAWEAMDPGLECACASFHGVWGSGPDDVWAVGTGGLIVHYDGTQWAPADTMPVAWMSGVWGSGPDDVFAVGEDAVFHYDGTGWTRMRTGLEESGEWLNRVWGLSSTNVYAAASNGVLHYDGTSWSPLSGLPVCEYWSVWGTATDNLFVAARQCGMEHYNGVSWAHLEPYGYVSEVWGTGPQNLITNGDGFVMRGTR
jgi:hypothetical protein